MFYQNSQLSKHRGPRKEMLGLSWQNCTNFLYSEKEIFEIFYNTERRLFAIPIPCWGRAVKGAPPRGVRRRRIVSNRMESTFPGTSLPGTPKNVDIPTFKALWNGFGLHNIHYAKQEEAAEQRPERRRRLKRATSPAAESPGTTRTWH